MSSYSTHSFQWVTAEEAVKHIGSNQRVFVQGAAMTPELLVEKMVARADELRNVELVHLHTEGDAPYLAEKCRESFHLNSFFLGGNVRKHVDDGYGDYIPIFLSEIHQLFRRKILPINVALIQVSPPDKHGLCSLGTSVDITLPAIQAADLVIAEVNPYVPRMFGDAIISVRQIDFAVQTDHPIGVLQSAPLSDQERKIGKHVAELVEDGATLQMGIGGIPNAVLEQLEDRRRLGVHTEMFTNGLVPLIKKGVITGENKITSPGKIVACFALGDAEFYEFIHDNPMIQMKTASYTNDTAVIRRNPKVTAINSAIEIDLTGQVCADSIGTFQYSGVGGQMDFIRGASLSPGGKAIIALPSITNKGISKITPFLKEGASVTTTRAHVHYIVTEFGIAHLYGLNLRQRAKALIEIAHPSKREELEKAAFERFKRF
ncbi:acetyl-CoA hydrolase/transferase family protein [Fulvivirga sedimenti]|uniref:4-hydroxybutyrate CoA-transferase n=1 Tax=Fulvivirga sedimenti TaxID=2879465 RepID=A0A9X1HMZ4_9BACT|nr:acetyl-CoA hydrolase/transferase C-terminal domain-containing protein [Fulvivirga sedimenti]MCA6073793.1 4-hydroxybutyrate CoA-transferase [Fulvivirga sedimenti]